MPHWLPAFFLFCAFTAVADTTTPADPWADTEWEVDETTQSGWLQRHDITGFSEIRWGQRIHATDHQRRTSLAEWRLRLEKEWNWSSLSLRSNIDIVYDDIEPSQHNDINDGHGWIDIRELLIERRIANLDLKAGRQIMTWGVGDLIFINDLFPKDWNSFLIGRDEQYLKAPSDAIRIGAYNQFMNIDLAITPEFDPDRYIDGRRLAYFNQQQQSIAGRHDIVQTNKPHGRELALRLYKTLGAYEMAFYGYDGYWKSPAGFDVADNKATFPKLTVLGASFRGPLANGIASIEVGHYDSRDDRDGRDPTINNSEIRGLIAYEWSPFHNATSNIQYYIEALKDYKQYTKAHMPQHTLREQYRHLLSTRFTYLSHQQNVTWSLFVFYSPSDHDAYLRPKINYKASDNWQLEAGLNLFSGHQQHTFFAQFEDNSNSYLSVQYHF